MKKAAISLLLALALGACARKYTSGTLPAVADPEGAAATPLQFTDEDVLDAYKRRPQLPVPFKVGVYFAHDAWDPKSKDAVLNLEEELRKTGLVEGFFYISPKTLEIASGSADPLGRYDPMSPEALKALRLTAARHGADALLVLYGNSRTKRESNWLSPLYTTLVGAFIVPGTSVTVTQEIHGLLWDVRNEFLYATVEAEGETHALRPTLLDDIGRKRLEERAREAALEDFRGDFLRSVRGLGG